MLAWRVVSLSLVLLGAACRAPGRRARHRWAPGNDWRTYLGDTGSTHYSTLDQITTANVAQLKVAWTFDAAGTPVDGDASSTATWRLPDQQPRSSTACCTRRRPRGRSSRSMPPPARNAGDSTRAPSARTRRATGSADSPTGSSGDDQRIFTSAGTWLYALDAQTGYARSAPSATTARSISAVGLGPRWHAVGPPEHAGRRLPEPADRRRPHPRERAGGIRAFDVRTGELKWIVPHDSATGRVRLRDVAGRRLEDRRRRVRLVRALGRRGARHRLRLDGDGGAGFLGRRPLRRESLRQLRRRARRQHRQAPLALPDRPSRPAGTWTCRHRRCCSR